MEKTVQNILDFFNTFIFGPALPFVVFAFGGWLFIKYGLFIICRPQKIISVITRKNTKDGISPFKTAMLALASTLGVGNIVGVSTAIYSGGPGAVFWLTLSAFAAMPLKYGEVVLAMKTRENKNGEYRGGAMYYMRKLLKSKTLPVIFAFLCIVNAFTVGNIVQINAVTESFEKFFSAKPIFIGTLMSVIIFLSISKGTKRVSGITSKLIPLATAIYTLLSLYIIIVNFGKLGSVLSLIIKEAFSVKAAIGGVGGYAITRAMRYGVARGIMSNEAGSGTSPIAHAKSNLESPAEQGFWGIFEVFADTVVMCNLTALVILFSYTEGVVEKGLTGMELVLFSYSKYAGNIAGYIIVISVFLFAYATVICQGFYGRECVYYLSEKKAYTSIYTLLYCLAVVYASQISGKLLWSLTDFNISLMTLINTVCILILSNEIKKETDAYFAE
ncbi:MAG: sodium:alanine symporter family protein [Clostridia bacterium]|nr:sodium:alanine symporter family protein [Clostridia bacterium]